MLKKLFPFALIFLFVACASTSAVKRTDPVTILLTNGDKIDAQVLDIWQDKVVFKAVDWKQAYEYGEVINVARIDGIQLRDGTQLSVKDYDAYRKGKELAVNQNEVEAEPALSESQEVDPEADGNFQYEELKKKPISEMTENEFQYFMMMKKQELQEEQETAEESTNPSPETIASEAVSPPAPSVEAVDEPIKPTGTVVDPEARFPATSENLDVVAESLIESGLAPSYLNYLQNKANSGEQPTAVESRIAETIKANPGWQEQLDDLQYMTRVAEKALSRAYLYNPQGLKEKLKLEFDPNLDMDFFNLMEQLHHRLGEDIQMGDFRVLVDVLDESGSRAVKQVLENYSSWKFAINQSKPVATK